MIVILDSTDLGNNNGLMIHIGVGGNQLNFIIRDTTDTILSGGDYNDGSWHHLVIQNPSSGMEIWVDGVLDASNTVDHLVPTSINNLIFGIYYNKVSGIWDIAATLDEIRIYNRGLMELEILQLYKAYDSEVNSQITLDILQEAYYKMDGNSNDATGNGHTATVSGASLTTGKIGQGYTFNGTSDYIEYVSGAQNLGLFTQAMSINVWANISQDSSTRMIVQCQDDNNSHFPIFYIYKSTTNTVIMQYRNNEGTVTTITSGTIANGWHMFTMIISATNREFLIDDVSIGSVATGTTFSTGNSANFEIGNSYQGWITSRGNYYNSIIDEVGVWTRAITGAEVTELYNSGAGLQYPYSVGHTNKVNGVTPSKINGIAAANISKVNGI